MLPIVVSVVVGAAFWYGAQYGPGIEWVLAFGLTYQAMQNEKALRDFRKELQTYARMLSGKNPEDEDR